jgi:hypothetical protein
LSVIASVIVADCAPGLVCSIVSTRPTSTPAIRTGDRGVIPFVSRTAILIV